MGSMRRLGRAIAGRLAVALAVVITLLCVSVGPSVFNDRHEASPATVAFDDAGHPRDREEGRADRTTKGTGGHHKNHSADHGHEKSGIPRESLPFVARPGGTVVASATDVYVSGLPERPDRPPEIPRPRLTAAAHGLAPDAARQHSDPRNPYMTRPSMEGRTRSRDARRAALPMSTPVSFSMPGSAATHHFHNDGTGNAPRSGAAGRPSCAPSVFRDPESAVRYRTQSPSRRWTS